MSKTRARVVVTKDGPYLVSGDVPLAKQTIVTDEEGGSEAWKESAHFKQQKSYALCAAATRSQNRIVTALTPESDLTAPKRQAGSRISTKQKPSKGQRWS